MADAQNEPTTEAKASASSPLTEAGQCRIRAATSLSFDRPGSHSKTLSHGKGAHPLRRLLPQRRRSIAQPLAVNPLRAIESLPRHHEPPGAVRNVSPRSRGNVPP